MDLHNNYRNTLECVATVSVASPFPPSLYYFCFFFLKNLSTTGLVSRSPKKNSVTKVTPNPEFLTISNLANIRVSEKTNNRTKGRNFIISAIFIIFFSTLKEGRHCGGKGKGNSSKMHTHTHTPHNGQILVAKNN